MPSGHISAPAVCCGRAGLAGAPRVGVGGRAPSVFPASLAPVACSRCVRCHSSACPDWHPAGSVPLSPAVALLPPLWVLSFCSCLSAPCPLSHPLQPPSLARVPVVPERHLEQSTQCPCGSGAGRDILGAWVGYHQLELVLTCAPCWHCGVDTGSRWSSPNTRASAVRPPTASCRVLC